jgi:hypothetical protein
VFDRMLIFNEKHLTAVLAEYDGHYNTHRPHQSRHQRPPAIDTMVTRPVADLPEGRPIRRRPVLGGLINEYYEAA